MDSVWWQSIMDRVIELVKEKAYAHVTSAYSRHYMPAYRQAQLAPPAIPFLPLQGHTGQGFSIC